VCRFCPDMMTFKVGPDRKLITVFACDETEPEENTAGEDLSAEGPDAPGGFLPEGGVPV
jgi:hypothetical protein